MVTLDGLIVKTAPEAAEVVSLADLRNHLNFTEVSPEIDAAIQLWEQEAVERVEGLTNRTLLETVYTWKLDCFRSNEIKTPTGPVSEIAFIKYKDPVSGEQITLEEGVDYEVDLTYEQARIRPMYGRTWPSVHKSYKPIEIEFTAGYSADDMPRGILLAIYLQVAVWFKNRAALVAVDLKELPGAFAFNSRIQKYALELVK